MRRAVTALLLVVAALALTAAPASAAPRSFFGVAEWGVPSAHGFKQLRRAHIGSLRTDLTWSAVEPRRGKRDWTFFDEVVRRSARYHVTLLPVILSSPSFAASRTGYPPMSASARVAFSRFVRDAVRRYGPNGTYWAVHNGLPKRPIRQWQIWAEPNFRAYWNGRPNAAQYVSLLHVGHDAVKSVDPRARVLLGGLAETRLGIPMRTFLRQVYQAGGKPYFDVVSIHPYGRSQRGVLGGVVRSRRVMRRYGDGRKRLRVTEFGWATAGRVSGGTRAFKTTLRGQSSKLRKTYRLLLKRRHRYHIDGVYWFSMHDRRRHPGERNWWGINTGLIRKSGRAKPAWRTLVRLARHYAR